MRTFSSPLSTLDLLAAFHHNPLLKKLHVGTFALDALESLLVKQRPAHLVYNTARSTDGPGRHWISIYLRADGRTAEIIDSLCQPLNLPEVKWFLSRHASRTVLAPRPLQSPYSNACGLYCISHAWARARGIGLNTWLARFSSDLLANDRQVQCEFMSDIAHPSFFYPPLPNWTRVLARACGRDESVGGQTAKQRQREKCTTTFP